LCRKEKIQKKSRQVNELQMVSQYREMPGYVKQMSAQPHTFDVAAAESPVAAALTAVADDRHGGTERS